jgi:large subunit ribosomal protein L4
MLKIDLYTLKGTKSGQISLPKEFGQKVNLQLLAQAVRVYEERGHIGLRQAKTRSEVNRTTKKVYKQKGTGGARHGSRRAPIFVGGGVAHGPRAVRREVSLSDKLKLQAKFSAFSYKAKENKLVALSGLNKLEKTKSAGEFTQKLTDATKAKRFTFILSEKNKSASKFIRNLKNSGYVLYRNLNAFDVWKGGLLVLDDQIFEKDKEKSVRVTAKK